MLNLDQPSRLSWSFDDLVSSDSHTLRCRFSASLRVAETDADRRMFEEVFLGNGKREPTTAVIGSHFASALRAAALSAAAKADASSWVTGDRKPIQTALLEAAKPIAFACGLELLPPFQVEIESATLQRQRLEAVQRARAEERTAGQVHHLQRAAELLKEFQAMRQQAPELSAGRLLEQVAPADRGLMLQSLLMASADQSQHGSLWAVAGTQLVRIDSRVSPPRVELFALSDELGPLRSVQPAEIDGKRVLLVGARSGVFLATPDAPQSADLFPARIQPRRLPRRHDLGVPRRGRRGRMEA